MFNFIGGTLSTPTFDATLTLFQHKGYDVDLQGNPVRDEYDSKGEPVPFRDPENVQGGIPLIVDGERLYYPDGEPRNLHHWQTTVVVYDWDNCANPNTTIAIPGYARITVTDVLNAPDKLIKGVVECELISKDNSRGGGGDFGIKGSIPGLVQ